MSTMRMKSGRADFAWMRPGRQTDRWVGRVLVCLALLVTAGQVNAQTVEYIHTDALGSPVATTNASGAVIERQVYEPYGAPISHGPTDGPRIYWACGGFGNRTGIYAAALLRPDHR